MAHMLAVRPPVFLSVALLAITVKLLAAEPVEPAVRLSVRPMAAPKPALKYQLLPEIGELNPGNAAQWYLRCFAEQRNFFFSRQGREQRTQLLTQPLSEINTKEFSNYGGSALRQADWAARLDTVDWQVLHRLQTEGMGLTQPEMEPLLILGEALKARFRVEIAGGRYDDAIRTAKTMFGFARHLGENPTEKAARLGHTIAGLALDTIEEMVQQKGCPNLYWALTDLPCPLVDIRKAVQSHTGSVSTELKGVRDDATMTDEQIEKVVSQLSGVLSAAREEAGHAPRSFRSALAARIKHPDQLKELRERLIKSGAPEGLVPNFSPLQIVLIEEKRLYENQRDDLMKLLALAPWQIDELTAGRTGTGEGLLSDLLPPAVSLRRQQARLEQRIGMLRIAECVRMYAAEHAGKLPARLKDPGLPLPSDPFTGKAYSYEASGATAHIRGSSPKGDSQIPAYEVVIGR